MLRFILCFFVVLHGLVHLWFFVLIQRLVEFKREMGWTGQSWLFTNLLGDSATRSMASVFYILVAVAFVASGIAVLFRLDWWRPMLIGSAVLSIAIIFLMWDGSMQLFWYKGWIGALISVVILLVLCSSIEVDKGVPEGSRRPGEWAKASLDMRIYLEAQYALNILPLRNVAVGC